MNYKELIQLFNPGFKQGAWDSWIRAKYKYTRNLYPYFFGHQCVLCGRKTDFLYHFVTLTSVYFQRTRHAWLNEELGVMVPFRRDVILLKQGQVMDVCEQHGGPRGLTVNDCRTGNPVYIPPRRWYYSALNLAQGLILHVTIALRWVWFYFAYLFNWCIGWRIMYWRKYGR